MQPYGVSVASVHSPDYHTCLSGETTLTFLFAAFPRLALVPVASPSVTGQFRSRGVGSGFGIPRVFWHHPLSCTSPPSPAGTNPCNMSATSDHERPGFAQLSKTTSPGKAMLVRFVVGR